MKGLGSEGYFGWRGEGSPLRARRGEEEQPYGQRGRLHWAASPKALGKNGFGMSEDLQEGQCGWSPMGRGVASAEIREVNGAI